jgi:Domain of unknown function (DUF4157)
VSASVSDDVAESLGSGQPLDHGTRGFLEPRLGHDLSRVRVHTDARAAASARALHARAFAAGHRVAFATGEYAPQSHEGRRLLAHELTHVVQQESGVGRRVVQRQLVTRPSGNTVGKPLGTNLREDVLSVMDRTHWVGALADADYATEHATVAAKAGGASISEGDIPETIKAITANEVDSLAPWQVEKILALRTGGDVGSGKANAAADVALLQVRLRALGILSDADFTAETGKPAIPRTLAAIKALRIRYVSGTLGWQPIRRGDWKNPDESQFGGDRFGGQTFEFTVTLPSFNPATDAAGASVNRSLPVSVFVPTQVTAPAGGGKPTATSTKVAVFFSPADVTGSSASNAVLTHGLRASDEASAWVLISVPGINDPVSRRDGWVAITNAAITFCLDRAGLPTTLGTVRLISHSRGAEGLKRTLTAKTLTATVDRIIVLDESTTFGPGGGKAGDLAPFISGAAPAKPGDPGITMAAGGGGVSYQVVAKPLGGVAKMPAIDPACARCIGYSRLIRDGVNENPLVAQHLFGPPPATPSAATPDWTGIWAQLLTLPERGKFSTKTPTPSGLTDIGAFCKTNKAAITAMDANVAADWAERKKPRASWNVNILQKSAKAFCDAHSLGLINFDPTIDAHHNFVPEIAHELFE